MPDEFEPGYVEAEKHARHCVAHQKPLGWQHVKALLGLINDLDGAVDRLVRRLEGEGE